MKLHRWVIALLAVVLLGASCPPRPTPAPDQPRLTGVRIVGQRVCGSFVVYGKEYLFPCDPLPTIGLSGWQLTPPWREVSGRQRANRMVVLTLTTPTLTNLRIDFEPSNTAVWTLGQRPPGPGGPLPVGARGEVEVDAADDGIAKTWTVTVHVGLCYREVPLKFYNLGADGSRSGGTRVVLVRADEGECEFSSGGGGGIIGMRASSPPPPTPPSPGPCPGGAARRFFGICENCGSPPDPRFDHWTGVEACDWNEVLQVFDYQNPDGTARFPKSQNCRPPRQLSREACEGP